MNIIRKAFAAVMLMAASLSSQAFDLPVHHQYVLFNSETRNVDYYNYDMHVVWHKEPDASQMGYYAQFAFYFQTGSVGYMGLQKKTASLARRLSLASGTRKGWLSLLHRSASDSITRATALAVLSLLNGNQAMSTNFACGASKTPLMGRVRNGEAG